MKCGELEASIDTFEKALDMARLQGDKQAENAIKKALDEVNKKIVRGIKDEGMFTNSKFLNFNS